MIASNINENLEHRELHCKTQTHTHTRSYAYTHAHMHTHTTKRRYNHKRSGKLVYNKKELQLFKNFYFD